MDNAGLGIHWAVRGAGWLILVFRAYHLVRNRPRVERCPRVHQPEPLYQNLAAAVRLLWSDTVFQCKWKAQNMLPAGKNARSAAHYQNTRLLNSSRKGHEAWEQIFSLHLGSLRRPFFPQQTDTHRESRKCNFFFFIGTTIFLDFCSWCLVLITHQLPEHRKLRV